MKKLILSLIFASFFASLPASTFAGQTIVDYSQYEGWYYSNYCTGLNNRYYGMRVLCDDINDYDLPYYPYSYSDNSYYNPSIYAYNVRNNTAYAFDYDRYDYEDFYGTNNSYSNYNYYDYDDYYSYNDSYYNYTPARNNSSYYNTSYYPSAYNNNYYGYSSSNINYNDPNFRNYSGNSIYTCGNGIVSMSPFDCNLRYR